MNLEALLLPGDTKWRSHWLACKHRTVADPCIHRDWDQGTQDPSSLDRCSPPFLQKRCMYSNYHLWRRGMLGKDGH